MRHSIQSALQRRRADVRSSGAPSRSPTAILEQVQERLDSMAQDMYIPNNCCGEEVVRFSLVRARKAASQQKRRTRRRNKVGPVKQGCSDTIEESISSTDEAPHQRKRARVYKGSSPQLHHTHPVQRILATFTSPIFTSTTAPLTTSSFANVTPTLGLFFTAFGSKQTKHAAAMSTFVVLRQHLSC